jgi:hypothetical protein
MASQLYTPCLSRSQTKRCLCRSTPRYRWRASDAVASNCTQAAGGRRLRASARSGSIPQCFPILDGFQNIQTSQKACVPQCLSSPPFSALPAFVVPPVIALAGSPPPAAPSSLRHQAPAHPQARVQAPLPAARAHRLRNRIHPHPRPIISSHIAPRRPDATLRTPRSNRRHPCSLAKPTSKRAALDPSLPPASQCPSLPTTPMRYPPSTAKF